MKSIVLIAVASIISMSVYAEDQTATIDGTGKKVALHENGMWEVLPEPEVNLIDQPKDLASAVTVFDTTLLVQEVDYKSSVIFAIRYENHTTKRVTGLVSSLVVKNGFGDVLYAETLQDDSAIEPGEKTSGDTYWHWDDNEFIRGEPYDKMWQAARNNTAKVEVKILKVVFEDGTILKAPIPQQKKKK